jgi:hypothetical protein
MVVLRSFVGFKEDSCFPSREHLCSIMECGKDTLTKLLSELKGAGYLKVKQEKEGNKFAKNVYFTSFSPCPSLSDTVLSDTEPSDTVGRSLRYTINKHVPSSKEVPSENTPIVPKSDLEEQALAIYQEYPLKAGKPKALQAIKRCLKEKSFEYLLEKTKSYAEIRGGNLDFVPHPATWFNQERFEDSPSTWYPSINGNKVLVPSNPYGLPE